MDTSTQYFHGYISGILHHINILINSECASGLPSPCSNPINSTAPNWLYIIHAFIHINVSTLHDAHTAQSTKSKPNPYLPPVTSVDKKQQQQGLGVKPASSKPLSSFKHPQKAGVNAWHSDTDTDTETVETEETETSDADMHVYGTPDPATPSTAVTATTTNNSNTNGNGIMNVLRTVPLSLNPTSKPQQTTRLPTPPQSPENESVPPNVNGRVAKYVQQQQQRQMQKQTQRDVTLPPPPPSGTPRPREQQQKQQSVAVVSSSSGNGIGAVSNSVSRVNVQQQVSVMFNIFIFIELLDLIVLYFF